MATVTNLPLRGLSGHTPELGPAHSLTPPGPADRIRAPAGPVAWERKDVAALTGLRGPAAVMTADGGGMVTPFCAVRNGARPWQGLVRHGVRPCRTSGQWPMPAGSSRGTASDVVRRTPAPTAVVTHSRVSRRKVWLRATTWVSQPMTAGPASMPT